MAFAQMRTPRLWRCGENPLFRGQRKEKRPSNDGRFSLVAEMGFEPHDYRTVRIVVAIRLR